MESIEIVNMTNFYVLGDYHVAEMEYLILQYLDPMDDYKNLMLVNKYYKEILESNKLYQDLRLFNSKALYRGRHIINFDRACQFGYFDLAQYLYSKYESIRQTDNGITIRNCCFTNQLEIANWLSTMIKQQKKRIHPWYLREAFQSCCKKRNIEMTKWLSELDNHLHVIEKNGQLLDWSVDSDYMHFLGKRT